MVIFRTKIGHELGFSKPKNGGEPSLRGSWVIGFTGRQEILSFAWYRASCRFSLQPSQWKWGHL
jgi:hypothetical protein